MKFINKYLALIIVLVLFGCDDFGDMNENPNAPTSIVNNPELLLTGLCKDPVNRLTWEAWDEGNLMAQYTARIYGTEFDQFEWGSSNDVWKQLYSSATVAQSLYDIGLSSGNNSYQAVSLIFKSWMFQILTDVYGEIPYSEALEAKSNHVYAPTYDTQETIYKGLIADLEEANTLLSEANSIIKGDLIYEGDLTKWRKLANSLHLRVLLRLSNVDDQTDIDVEGEIKKIITNSSQYPVMESNDDNAALAYTSTYPNVHPISEENYRIGSFSEYRMSETIEKVLEAYDDPRQKKWYDPTDNSVAEGNPIWTGMVNGMAGGDAYTYKGGAAYLSVYNNEFFYYSPNYLEGIIMLSSEVQFIKAEAAVRYSSVAAVVNAKDAYEQGIQLSFEYWDVTMPDDYLTRTSSNPDVTVPVAFDGEIETIITQKWLALLNTDYQGFLEFKRTSFPSQIKPGPDALLDEYPSRFTYYAEEQTLNKENYDIAVSRQGPDEYSTPVWWENK